MRIQDPKTTIAGILAILPNILLLFGVPVPAAVVTGVQSLGVALLGWLAKDSTQQ